MIIRRNETVRKDTTMANRKPDKNIEYLEGKNVLGDDPETTVDNYHLTDLGFVDFAQRLAPVIQRLIKQ